MELITLMMDSMTYYLLELWWHWRFIIWHLWWLIKQLLILIIKH